MNAYTELVKTLRYEATWCEDFPEQKKLFLDAADAIEKLQNYEAFYCEMTDKAQGIARELIDKYPKWIPVTERLPQIHRQVLVFSPTKRTGTGIDFLNKEGMWYTTPNVTHWMPLPPPPKGTQDED